MSERFEWDDTNSSGIWWSTNVSIRDECILLKEDTQCEDSDIVELLRNILSFRDFEFLLQLLLIRYLYLFHSLNDQHH